ncbi:hypothetical protein NQZ79_g4256 [Umbelopsis isabellina]|nr:hypothetical protein NQZ79_g4256 [Umbelopsis isabellina]
MSSVYQSKQTDSEKKSQEQELIDNARYHTELETAKDDAERASDVHKERTGKALDTSDKNVMEGEFPEKK